MTRVGVVVNPTAGRGRGHRIRDTILAALTARGLAVEDLSAPDAEGALASAREGSVRGLDALVVAGGDGMVRLGTNVVGGTGLPLGIVAIGSGNDQARSLGLPVNDVPAAVEVIARAIDRGPRPIDAVSVSAPGYAGHEWFLGVLSAGLDAAVNARANRMSWPAGPARYVVALAAELPGFRPYGYRVLVDGEAWTSSGTLVCVANSPAYGGGMRIAPGAAFDDGLLDVVLVGPVRRLELVRIFPLVYRGRHVRHPAVTVVRGRDVLVEPHDVGPHPSPPDAFADGEPVGPLPIRCTIRPGAVQVLGPTPEHP